MSFEKASRDRAVLGALHDGLFVEVSTTTTPNFDGGVCASYRHSRPRLEWDARNPDDGAWQTVELEDGRVVALPAPARSMTTGLLPQPRGFEGGGAVPERYWVSPGGVCSVKCERASAPPGPLVPQSGR